MIIKQNSLKWNGKLSARVKTKYLIFHHAAWVSCTLEDIHREHLSRGWLGFGYNFYIRKDGTVHQGRPIWAEGAHTQGYNESSIGICFEGDFDVEYMTREQIQSGIELIRYIRKQFPNVVLFRHADLNKTSCPGSHFSTQIILEGMKDMEQPKHWAEDIYNELTEKYGITIHEKRFDEPIKRSEMMALMLQLIKKYEK